jgi:peptide deformylase
MILPITKIGDPILETPCKEIENVVELLKGSISYSKYLKLRLFINDMIETARFHDAAGLAANQVGENLRIFIIQDCGKNHYTREGFPDVFSLNYEVCINPKIISKSIAETITAEEGCLSVPHIWAQVPRPKRITIKYFNEKGEKKKRELVGLAARIALHEQDHLDGILFLQRATSLRYVKGSNLPIIKE